MPTIHAGLTPGRRHTGYTAFAPSMFPETLAPPKQRQAQKNLDNFSLSSVISRLGMIPAQWNYEKRALSAAVIPPPRKNYERLEPDKPN